MHAVQTAAQQQQKAQHALQVGQEPAEALDLAGRTGLTYGGFQGSPAHGPRLRRLLQLLPLGLQVPQHLLEELGQLHLQEGVGQGWL